MSHESPELETTFGYLSAVHTTEHGYFGGYLIVSAAGRPLEFHCTAPVMPSRAQQILYGPTLRPYLIGEQIGGTLLRAAQLTPRVILTNQDAAAGLRAQGRVPIVLVLHANIRPSETPELTSVDHNHCRASSQLAIAADEGRSAWSHPFTVGSQQLRLPVGYEVEQEAIVAWLNVLIERVQLSEPFERIHEAIREAQRIGACDEDAHGQAA